MDKEEDKVIFLKKKIRFRITMDTYVAKRPEAGGERTEEKSRGAGSAYTEAA